MAIYKCEDCSHEIISTSCPTECQICGHPKLKSLESYSPYRKTSTLDESIAVKKVDRDILHPKKSTASLVPPAIKGWNWGAFLLALLWSIDHRVWIGLLCIIPYVGFVMAIVLGVKGNEWAWKSRSWSSIEQFKARQRTWAVVGIIIFIIFFILGLLASLSY
jgi:hypothetical protein